MRPHQSGAATHPWAARSTVPDTEALTRLGAYVPAAAAATAVLWVVRGAAPHPVVDGLATVGLALVPPATFAVVVRSTGATMRRAPLELTPTLLDAGLSLVLAGAALAVVFAPLYAPLAGVAGPALLALVATAYVAVPFWLGTRLLVEGDGVDAATLTVQVTLAVLLVAALVLAAMHPLASAELGVLAVVGLVGPVAIGAFAGR